VGGLNNIAAVAREPVDGCDEDGSEADAPFADRQALLVDLTIATDNIKIATGDAGFVDGAVGFDPFFEAAAATAVTAGFPDRVDRGFRRFSRGWIAGLAGHGLAS